MRIDNLPNNSNILAIVSREISATRFVGIRSNYILAFLARSIQPKPEIDLIQICPTPLVTSMRSRIMRRSTSYFISAIESKLSEFDRRVHNAITYLVREASALPKRGCVKGRLTSTPTRRLNIIQNQ